MGINKRNVGKILLISNSQIGDFVLYSNGIREIRREFPKAEITLIVSNINKELAKKNKNVDKIIVLDYSPRRLTEFIDYFKITRKLRKENFDIGIDLRGGFFNILFFLFLSKVKYKVGLYHQELSKFFLNYGERKNRDIEHCTLTRLKLINKALGLNRTDNWPDIWVDGGDKKEVEKLMKENKIRRNFICILPHARFEKKQWPIENFEEIINYIQKKYPEKQIVLIGIDEEKIKKMVDENPETIGLLNLNLRILYLLFKKSDLVIGNDGGPMHLAWAGKSKSITLMADHLKFNYVRPLGENSHYFYKDLKKLKTREVEDKIGEMLK